MKYILNCLLHPSSPLSLVFLPLLLCPSLSSSFSHEKIGVICYAISQVMFFASIAAHRVRSAKNIDQWTNVCMKFYVLPLVGQNLQLLLWTLSKNMFALNTLTPGMAHSLVSPLLMATNSSTGFPLCSFLAPSLSLFHLNIYMSLTWGVWSTNLLITWWQQGQLHD